MTQTDRYLTISATVFVVVALAHLVRAIAQWSITIGPWSVPVALSWVAALATAGLSAWGFFLLRKPRGG
jgi:hypothetical protein